MATRKIIYPGTFDPVTNGHVALVERALALFDEVIIAVVAKSPKNPLFDLAERMELLHETFDVKHLPIQILSFQGFLIDFVRMQQAKIILRGLRVVADFEYELQLDNINKHLAPEIETMFLMANENNAFVSSTFIKEIAALNGPVERFVPILVAKALRNKLQKVSE